MIRLNYTGDVMAMADTGMEELRAHTEQNIDVIAAARQLKEYKESRLAVNAAIESEGRSEYGFTGSSQAYRSKYDDATLVLPIKGMIEKDMSLMTMIMGGTSTEMLGAQVDKALEDDSVQNIVLLVDSPGGSIKGVGEVTQKIRELSAQKTVMSVADGTMASAAYWIGSAASKIGASPSSQIGSIGTLAVLQNINEAQRKAGIDTRVVRSLPMKGKPNKHEEFTGEGLAHIQSIVDAHHERFVSDVLTNRQFLTQAQIESMKGQIMIAADALDAGLADEEVTLDAALKALAQAETPEKREEMAMAIATGVQATFEGAADADDVKRLQATVEALQDGMNQQSVNAETVRIEAMVKEAAGNKIPAAKAESYVQKGKEHGAEWLEETLAMIPEGATVPQGDGTKIGAVSKGEGVDMGEKTPNVDAESQNIFDQLGVDPEEVSKANS